MDDEYRRLALEWLSTRGYLIHIKAGVTDGEIANMLWQELVQIGTAAQDAPGLPTE